MRYRDWYFKDWTSEQQVGPTGKTQWVYVYTGRYYLLPEPQGRFKRSCLLVMLFYLAGFVFLNFFPSPGGRNVRIAGISMLQIFPLIFFSLSARPLILAGPKMTYRRYRRTIHRMRWGAALGVPILMAQLIMEIRFILMQGGLFEESVYLTVLCLELLLMGTFAFFIFKLKLDTAEPDPKLEHPADE